MYAGVDDRECRDRPQPARQSEPKPGEGGGPEHHREHQQPEPGSLGPVPEQRHRDPEHERDLHHLQGQGRQDLRRDELAAT